MTMTDDQFLADELRSIFDEHSAHGAPVVDRRAGVGRRISRHKRVRTMSALMAVVFAAGSTAGALTWQGHHGAPVRPTATPSPTQPGQLPEYFNGGHRDASATIDVAQQAAGSFTFVPTSWDMQLTEACAATGKDVWLVAKLNGHNVDGMSCEPDGGSYGSNGGTFGHHEKFWRDLGVRLGVPSTVTFEVGKRAAHTRDLVVTPLPSSGLASVGVYNPVPYDEYPLPPKPSDWSATASGGRFDPEAGMRQLGQIGTFGESDVSQPLSLTLPSRLEITMQANAPGIIRVYFDGVEVAESGSYSWGSGYDSGAAAVGTEQFAGFVTGQHVVVTVQTEHFTVPNAAEVLIYGK